MSKEGKYYVLKNKNLAITISYILGEDFYKFDDRFKQGKKVYSFKNTKEFKEVLTKINELKAIYNK